MDLLIPYDRQALTADGGSDGTLTLVSTAKLRRGARVWLSDNNSTSVELVIDQVINSQKIAVRDPSKIGMSRFDCSAFTVAQSAALSQSEQTDFTMARGWADSADTAADDADIRGADVWVGTITATTTAVANTNTAVPFPVAGGQMYSIQPDAECYVATGVSQADAIAKAVAASGTVVEAKALYDRLIPSGHTHIAVSAVAGTVNAKVNQLVK